MTIDFDISDIPPNRAIDELYADTLPDQTTNRRLLVSLVDLSDSMNAVPQVGASAGAPNQRLGDAAPITPIMELDGALRSYLLKELDQDQQFGLSGEIAVGGFWGAANVAWMDLGTPVRAGSNVYWVRYVTARLREREASGNPFRLIAEGGTPLLFAVNNALDLIEERRREWGPARPPAHRPILVVLTDGVPTDMFEQASRRVTQLFTRTKERLHDLEARKMILFWVACTADADEETLMPLADKGNMIALGDKRISSFITLMQMSPDIAKAGGSRDARTIYTDLRAKWDRDVR